MSTRHSATLRRVLESAARLQQAVPDAVLVGGAAAALHAGHRDSFDHDHVLADLADRYAEVLETCEVEVGEGLRVVAPTADEALRVKAYLVLQRNQVRDYLDVVALVEHLGPDRAVEVLLGIDDYYDDRSLEHGSVLTALVLALAEPAPLDAQVTRELPRYKGLSTRWHQWSAVVAECRELSLHLAGAV